MTTINIGKVQIQLSGPHWREWHFGVSWYSDLECIIFYVGPFMLDIDWATIT